MSRRATTDLDICRTYYEGVDGPVWVTHEQRGPERVTSLLVIDGWRASFEWPPGVTRSMLENIDDRAVRGFADGVTRHLIAAAIVAGHLPDERCDHVGEGGLCTRRWTIEVAYDHVRLHRCTEHGYRFLRDPGPSGIFGERLMIDPRVVFERVTRRGDGVL